MALIFFDLSNPKALEEVESWLEAAKDVASVLVTWTYRSKRLEIT